MRMFCGEQAASRVEAGGIRVAVSVVLEKGRKLAGGD